MASYWFFILILTSIIFINPVFSDSTDIEIDWLIEGQIPIVSSEINVESDSIMGEEQINNFISTENKIFRVMLQKITLLVVNT